MQLHCFLAAIMIHQVCARLSIAQLESMPSFELCRNGTAVGINTEGPLNMACGYVYTERGFMHNKRFFSSEIETDYSLRPKGGPESIDSEYIFTRMPSMDFALPCAGAEGPLDAYTHDYHSTLIRMFPSEEGELSIKTERENSLFQT
ncbi:uncharacterized protein NEMAJ01_1844, partial [Nematocida major]|uniref:uncharacterized protein n=1 Tax=Nematocida major TaxID=1912982 RepID=UPI002008D2F2